MHDCGVGYEEEFSLWERDAALLPEIGRLISDQSTSLKIRLPRKLADQVVATWQRSEDQVELPSENPDQSAIRHRAASVALIGQAIEETGVAEGEDVVFTVDAWFVGDALSAADEAGLLND